MAHIACELLWLKNLLIEFGFKPKGLMLVYCDNMYATYIAKNSVVHNYTKYTEVDCYLVRNATMKKVIYIPFTRLEQLVNVFTKTSSL